jgi:galactose mutarotase-like enzyme
LNYGGIVTALRVPDRNGKLDDIVLGYDTMEPYVRNPSYFAPSSAVTPTASPMARFLAGWA